MTTKQDGLLPWKCNCCHTKFKSEQKDRTDDGLGNGGAKCPRCKAEGQFTYRDYSNPIDDLKFVLCDPDGKCCISGSDKDRRIIDKALSELTRSQQKPSGDVQAALDCLDHLEASLDGCYADYEIKTIRAALTEQQPDVNAELLEALNKAEFELGVAKSNIRLLTELSDAKDAMDKGLLEALKYAVDWFGQAMKGNIMDAPNAGLVIRKLNAAIARAEQKGQKND